MEVLEWPHGVRLASGIECVRRPPPGYYLPSGIEEVVSVAPSQASATKSSVSVEAPLPSFCMLIKLPRSVNYASCLTLAEQVTIGMEGGMRNVMSRLPEGMCLASRVSRNLPFPPGMSYVPPTALDPKLAAAINEVNSKSQSDHNEINSRTQSDLQDSGADASIHNSSTPQKVQVKRNLCLEVVKLAPHYSFPAGTELIPGVFVQRRPVWLQTPPGVELVTRYVNDKGDLLHFGPGIHRVSMRPEYVDTDGSSIPSDKEVRNAHYDIISLEQVRSTPPARLPNNVELVQITEQCRQVHSWGPYLPGVEVVELTTLADREPLQPLPPFHFLIQRPLTKNSTPLPLGLKRGIAEEYAHWFLPPLLPSTEIIHIVPKFSVPMGINVMNTKVLTRSKPSRSSTNDGDGDAGGRRISAAVEVYSIPELSHGEFISPGLTVIARPFGSKAYSKLIESDPIYTKEPHVFIYSKDMGMGGMMELPDSMTEDSRSAEAVEHIFGEELPVALRPCIISSSNDKNTNMQQQHQPLPPLKVSDVIKFVRLSSGLPQSSSRFKPYRSSVMIQRLKGSSSIGNARDYETSPSNTVVVYPRLIQLAKRLVGKTVDNFDQTNEYLTNTIVYRMMGQQKLPLLPEPAFTNSGPLSLNTEQSPIAPLSLNTQQPPTAKLDQDRPVEDGRQSVSAGGSMRRCLNSTQTQTPSSSSSFQQEINESSMWRLQDWVDQLDSDNTRNKELVAHLTVENDAMKLKVSSMTTQVAELQELCKYDGDLKALISRMNVKLAEKDLELGVLKSTGHLATTRLANQVDVLNSQVAAFQESNAMMPSEKIVSITSSGSEDLRKEREEERLFDLFDEVHDYYQDRVASIVHTLSTLFTDCILNSVSDFESTLLSWSARMESAQHNSLPSSNPVAPSNNSSLGSGSGFNVPVPSPFPSEPVLPDLSDEDLSILTDDNSSVNTYLRYRPQDLTRDVHGKLVPVDAAFPLDIKRLYRTNVTPLLAEPSKNIGLAKRSELNTPIVHVGAPSAIAYHQTSKPGSAEKKTIRSINYMKLPHIMGSSSTVDDWGHSSSLVSKELSAHRLSEFLLKDPQVKRLKTELETSAQNLPKFARVDVGLQMDKLFNDVEHYLSKFILDSKAVTATEAEESKNTVTSKDRRRLKDNHSEATAEAHQNLQDQLGRITANTKQFLTFLLQSHLNHTDASFRLLDVESEILHKNMDKASSRCEMMELMLHESRARFLNLTAGGGLTEEYMHSSLEALRSKVLELQATIDIMQALHVHEDVSLLKALVSKAYDLSELEQGLRFSALMFKQKATKDEQIARTNNRALLYKRSSDATSDNPTGDEEDETNRLSRAEKGAISTGELKAIKNTARNWRKKSNLCYKKAETLSSEIKEVHALIMNHLQMYQREAQSVIPFDMMEQILKANYRSTQQIRHHSSSSFTSSSDAASVDIEKVKLSADMAAAVAACISDSTADLNSVSSSASSSSTVVSNVDAPLSTHSTATGSIAGSLKSSTTLSSLKVMKPKNSDILAERMKAISQPTIKFGATGSLPPASAQSHLRFVGPLKRTVHK